MSLALLSALPHPAGAEPGKLKLRLAKEHRQTGSHEFRIATVSTRNDMVSGGDVLVRIDVAERIALDQVRLELNGSDVTAAFRPVPGGHSLLGLVRGLVPGDNKLVASRGGRGPRAALTLTNHPITGPIFSGPHQEPFVCQTQEASLGPPLDENCSAPTTFQWFYRTTAGQFRPFAPGGPRPADLAWTTTIDGTTVDYVVRVERGTINRAIYHIAILDEGSAAPGPGWSPGAGWNSKLQYRFGGGCGKGYRQGADAPSVVLADAALSRGYAVATASLNTYGVACNDVLSAETALMVKEHFIETYGVPRYTTGTGGSGGAMQQHAISQNYPGILDALFTTSTFPDVVTLWHSETDCELLDGYWERSTLPWTEEQQTAVIGFARRITCGQWWDGIRRPRPGFTIDITIGCDIPPALVYDPVTNPGGARCSLYESQINLYGTEPATGFVRRPLDNVGVQYGLRSFNDGVITFEQFLDLNRHVGGFDALGKPVADIRTEGDVVGIRNGYRGGRVYAGQNVHLPIIDIHTYREAATGDYHDRFRVFALQDRLIATNGHAENHVMWEIPVGFADAEGLALDTLDRWLERLLRDTSDRSYEQKVLAAKPADVVDGCYQADRSFIAEPQSYDGTGLCNQLYPPHANPRIVAGAPFAENVIKCRRKPVDPADYTTRLTRAQIAQLRAAFPHGVCDYSKRGVEQRPPKGGWITFGSGASVEDDDDDH